MTLLAVMTAALAWRDARERIVQTEVTVGRRSACRIIGRRFAKWRLVER